MRILSARDMLSSSAALFITLARSLVFSSFAPGVFTSGIFLFPP